MKKNTGGSSALLKSTRTWSRGRWLLSVATQLHRKGAGTEVKVNKPRVRYKEDGPLLLSGRVFWGRSGQQYGVMNEWGNEQSSSPVGVGRGQVLLVWAGSQHNYCWSGLGWEQLEEKWTAESHRSEDMVHALTMLRHVLLQIGISTVSCEMTVHLSFDCVWELLPCCRRQSLHQTQWFHNTKDTQELLALDVGYEFSVFNESPNRIIC